MSVQPYGVFSPTITAFHDDESLSEDGTRQYIRYLLENGVHGLAPMGSAGEIFAMTDQERMQVTEWILTEVGGKVPVYAGVGHCSTATSIKLGLHTKDHGADGLLVITPYFFGPR